MKRLITAAMALSLLGATAASAAPHGDRHDNGRHNGYEQSRDRHDNNKHHRWARGQRLPSNYYQDRSRYIDYRAHKLRAPPRGYRWVRADDNYALVAITTGLIASLVAASN